MIHSLMAIFQLSGILAFIGRVINLSRRRPLAPKVTLNFLKGHIMISLHHSRSALPDG